MWWGRRVSGRWGVPVTTAVKEIIWPGKSHVYWKNIATPAALWVPGRGSQWGQAEVWQGLVGVPFSPVFPTSVSWPFSLSASVSSFVK